MRPTDLANPAWLTATVRHHHRELGLPDRPGTVDLLDVCIKHPHRPDSRRCRGWATVRVPPGAGVRSGPVFLFRSEEAAAPGTRSGTTIPGLPLRVWRFPDDPDLPFLAAMTDPEQARTFLPGDLAHGCVVEEVRVVRWQPGVSATLRCALSSADGHAAVYAKLLARDDLLAVDATQRRLHTHPPDGLRVAEPLGVDPGRRILWTREVDGRKLAGPGGDPVPPIRAASLAGRSLAALHTSGPILPDRTVAPADVVAEAAKKARKIAAAQPRHDRTVARLATLVAGLLKEPSTPCLPLHGDFHLDQMLLTEHDLVLLDLDEMATGDPALDLAEMAVDLGLRRLSAATSARFLSTLGHAYALAGGSPSAPAVLRGYAAAELLNRCYRRLRRPVPGWEQALDDDLGAADAVLTGAGLMAPRVREEVRT